MFRTTYADVSVHLWKLSSFKVLELGALVRKLVTQEILKDFSGAIAICGFNQMLLWELFSTLKILLS